jgi:hypothetical protein
VKVTLERFLSSNEGVFGTLTVGNLVLFTVEKQWRNNQSKVSCIPAGTYQLAPHHSPHLNIDTYQIMGVPGRDEVLLHPANTEEDLLGCVGVGLNLGVLAIQADEESGRPVKKLAVVRAKPAFTQLIAALGGAKRTDLSVDIRWVNPDSDPES